MKTWDWVSAGLCAAWLTALLIITRESTGRPSAAWLQSILPAVAILVAAAAIVVQDRRHQTNQEDQARQAAIKDEMDRLRLRADQLESLSTLASRLQIRCQAVRFEYDYFYSWPEDDFWALAEAFNKVEAHLLRDPVVTAVVMNLKTEANLVLRLMKKLRAAYDDAIPHDGSPDEKQLKWSFSIIAHNTAELEARLGAVTKKMIWRETQYRSPLIE